MTTFTDTIPHLNIEVLPDGLIRLENESMGDSYAVDIHLIQLQHIAEKVGLVRKMSASEADAMRTVIELQRRLLALKDRIDHLGEYLALHSDHRHADLNYETNYATATADICDAYCSDFGSNTVTPPNEQSQVTPDNASGNAASVTSPLPSAQFDLVA
ncbi:hypothetical protein [Polaromonas eurypsychrophila]|uniref:Uncharacterized protein n=1 Tax=Polaromonas eurypsychrophila TaxID=1614635 RepID=A0A916SJV4_9BURK|nr:hypothetical protein [Polaromonas eurypsychrophila]GGB03665.1 hypothetical protein GCM10011496_25770 [Polaromonas eurypsychrophila]